MKRNLYSDINDMLTKGQISTPYFTKSDFKLFLTIVIPILTFTISIAAFLFGLRGSVDNLSGKVEDQGRLLTEIRRELVDENEKQQGQINGHSEVLAVIKSILKIK